MRIQRKLILALVVSILAMFTSAFVTVTPAFSKGEAALSKTTPNPKSHNHNVTYQTVPITMQMEAGVPFHLEGPEVGMTIHSGIGWIMPFGRASYVGGVGYPVADEYRVDFMWEYDEEEMKFNMVPSWGAMFSTGLFCIYHLEDGDIYAWDGVMGNVEAAITCGIDEDGYPIECKAGENCEDGVDCDDGKVDYLMNVIVGGTGRYRNASGILLGRTPGRGDAPGTGLPKVLMKIMEGYINIQVKDSKYRPMLPTVGTKNPQKWPEALGHLIDGELIPINLEFEAGRDQWDPYGDEDSTTFIAGTGWIEPFGRAEYHYGMNFPESREDGAAPKPDFMNDTWLRMFPTKNLCVYDFGGNNLIYVYDGIMGNLVPDNGDGKSDYIIEVIVGGKGDFAGASGILLGYTFGRGDAAIPTSGGASGPFPLPDSIIKIMEGYIIIK